MSYGLLFSASTLELVDPQLVESIAEIIGGLVYMLG